MKTIEEKAKAYDEALEKARKRVSTEPQDHTDAILKDIFPELRESDDERIRKALYNYFHHGDKMPFDTGVILAWLEKQKEQKPAQFPQGFYYIDHNGNKYYSKEFRYGDMKVKVGEQKPEVKCVHLEEYPMTPEECIKPAEFDDKDAVVANSGKQDYSGLTDLERAIHRGFLCAGVENVPVTIIKETAQDCLAHIKPAEWSEEDKEMRLKILKYLSTRCSVNEYEEVENWLNNIFPNPRWRPGEQQLGVLWIVSNDDNLPHAKRVLLRSLYNDLLKLK